MLSSLTNTRLERLDVLLLLSGREGSKDNDITIMLLAASLAVTATILYSLHRSAFYDDGLPVVNRNFSFEPRVFARIRWASRSRDILDEAEEKYHDTPFRLARGDTDLTVLPPRFVQELNRLPEDAISSRRSHASTLLGHLNGMNVVLKTNRHVKMLLNRITPALPILFSRIGCRVQETIDDQLSSNGDEWRVVRPVESIVLSISRGVAFALFGTPECDLPELYSILSKHTQNVFGVGFTMRVVPAFLQPSLVWLLPVKWRLELTWKSLERLVYPLVRRRIADRDAGQPPSIDLVSCLVSDDKAPGNDDPELLKGLIGSTSAGATYSTTALIVGVITDLVANPAFLDIILQEIGETFSAVGSRWTFETLDRLEKLDSALKETTRCMPPTLVNYSRVILKDHTLSNGLRLKRGQRVCISGRARVMDPAWFPRPHTYDALRSYNRDLQEHRSRPFSSPLSDDFRWGAGRWACPGRYLAAVMAKMILVKLLDEYDFRFVDGKPPARSLVHEFLFFHPDIEMEVRPRETALRISFD